MKILSAKSILAGASEGSCSSRYSNNLIIKIITEERGNNTDFQHQIELTKKHYIENWKN